MITSSETSLRPTVTFSDIVAVANIIHDSHRIVPTFDDHLQDKHTTQPMTRRSPAEIIDPQKRTSDLNTLLETQNKWMKETTRLHREAQNEWMKA